MFALFRAAADGGLAVPSVPVPATGPTPTPNRLRWGVCDDFVYGNTNNNEQRQVGADDDDMDDVDEIDCCYEDEFNTEMDREPARVVVRSPYFDRTPTPTREELYAPPPGDVGSDGNWIGDAAPTTQPQQGFRSDCCRDSYGNPLVDGEDGQVWCFGCQWGVDQHRPVDHEKIGTLVNCFRRLVTAGTTTMENTAMIVSDMYRKTIRVPSLARGQWLPDWPPEVVLRHIELMINPDLVFSEEIRKQRAVLRILDAAMTTVDPRTGLEVPNLPAMRVRVQCTRELRELYRVQPKECIGYNDIFAVPAHQRSDAVLVHPSRIAAQAANIPNDALFHLSRGLAVDASGADTGDLRVPSNDEELVQRFIGTSRPS